MVGIKLEQVVIYELTICLLGIILLSFIHSLIQSCSFSLPPRITLHLKMGTIQQILLKSGLADKKWIWLNCGNIFPRFGAHVGIHLVVRHLQKGYKVQQRKEFKLSFYGSRASRFHSWKPQMQLVCYQIIPMTLSKMGTMSEVCPDFAEHTTVAGLHFVAKYKRTAIKVLWLCLTIGLFIGYSWHCYRCVMKYLDYPTAVQTTIGHHPLTFPAVTFCNANPFVSDRVRAQAPELQKIVDDLNETLYETSGQQKRKKRAVKSKGKKAQTSSLCQANWEKVGSSCYLITGNTSNWNDAVNYCTMMNSTLPIFYNMSDYVAFSAWWNNKMNMSEVWLGLTSQPANATWTWLNNCSWKHFPAFWRTCWDPACALTELTVRAHAAKYSNAPNSQSIYIRATGVEPVDITISTNQLQLVCYQPIANYVPDCYEFPSEKRTNFLCNTGGWWCATENDLGENVTTAIESDSCFCLNYLNQSLDINNQNCSEFNASLADMRSDEEETLIGVLIDEMIENKTIQAYLCPSSFSYFNGSCFIVKLSGWSLQTMISSCNAYSHSQPASLHSIDEQWFLHHLHMSLFPYPALALQPWYSWVYLGANRNTTALTPKDFLYFWFDGSPMDYIPEWAIWEFVSFISEPNSYSDISAGLLLYQYNGMMGDNSDSSPQFQIACKKQIPNYPVYPVLTISSGNKGYELWKNSKNISSVKTVENQTIAAMICRIDRATTTTTTTTATTTITVATTTAATTTNLSIAALTTSKRTTVEEVPATSIVAATVAKAAIHPSFKGDELAVITNAQERLLYTVSSMDSNVMSNLSYSLNELLSFCSFNSTKCLKSNFEKTFNPSVGNCFTYNVLKKPFLSLTRSGHRYGLKIGLKLNMSTYLLTTLSPGFLLTVHDQNHVVFSNTESIHLLAGFQTDISLNLNVVKVKPYLYSNCIDANSAKYPNYSLEGCYRLCQQKLILNLCKCCDPSLPLNTTATYCSLDQKQCVDAAKLLFNNHHCNCPTTCKSVIHSQTTTVVKLTRSVLTDNDIKLRNTSITDLLHNTAYINIYYQSLTFTTTEQVPAYDLQSLFLDLSKFLCLWLAYSVISLFQFIPFGFSLTRAICCPVK